MKQKGFATILGLGLILVIALTVRGIHEAEANHAREFLNFQMEQALQNAAYSGIIEAVDKAPNLLPPYVEDRETVKERIPVENKNFENGDRKIEISMEVWGERGKIYCYNEDKKLLPFKTYDENGNEVGTKNFCMGIYIMSLAAINNDILGEKIYRRAYAYLVEDEEVADEYRQRIYFMELPTLKASGENYTGVITKR